MSKTRVAVRTSIQDLLGDTIPAEPIWSVFRYNEAINRNINLLAGRSLQIDSIAQTVTLIAGTYDYALTAAAGEMAAILQAFHVSSGQEILPLPWTEFNSQYRQDTSAPAPSGVPCHFTLWEATGTPRIRLGPTPNATGTVSLHEKTTVDLPTADGSTITFSDSLIRSLEASAGADLVESASREMLDKARLDRSFARTLRGQAEQGLRDHNLRKLRLGRRQSAVIRRGYPEFGMVR